MTSQQPKKLSIKTVGIVLLTMSGLAFYFRCFFIAGCNFGKYRGEIALMNEATQQPLSEAAISYYIDNSSHPFAPMGEVSTATTNTEGEAEIVFDNTFLSPLTIVFTSDYETTGVYSVETGILTPWNPIIKNEQEKSTSGAVYGDQIELKIEIKNWSLF